MEICVNKQKGCKHLSCIQTNICTSLCPLYPSLAVCILAVTTRCDLLACLLTCLDLYLAGVHIAPLKAKARES